jgi:hypothetical protein
MSFIETRINMYPMMFRTGMKTRIEPTCPSVFACERLKSVPTREPLRLISYRPGFAHRVVIPPKVNLTKEGLHRQADITLHSREQVRGDSRNED